MLQNNAFIEEFVINPYKIGRLSGLTFSVKDCIDIKSYVTGFGNPTWKNTHHEAVVNAVCIEKLLLDGAKCVGKAVMDEFAYSLIGDNQFYGTPLNPQLPDHVPGGSSSGSASSVASGMVEFSLGTDTGGSVRVPAANCGIYGFRPTHGKISVAGVVPLAPSLDTVGVLAKDFFTLQKVTNTLLEESRNNTEISSLVVIEDFVNLCSEEIRSCFYNFLDLNKITYEKISLAHELRLNESLSGYLKNLYSFVHSVELWSVHGAWVESVKPELGMIARYNFENIAKIADRNKIPDKFMQRRLLSNVVNNLLNGNKIFCFPTVPEISPKRGIYSSSPEFRTSSFYSEKLIAINSLESLTQSPQITIPIAQVELDYSIGLSFMAQQSNDSSLFNFINFLNSSPYIS